MKKIFLILVIALSLIGCSSKKEEATINNPITLASTKADMSGYVYFKDSDHAFELISVKESTRMYSEKGTGVLYYGYPECPFCNRIVPVLNDAAKELGVKVYYVDIYEKGVTQEDVNTMFANLDPILQKDKNNQTVFYVPEVVAIKDGKIVNHHLSILDDYKNVADELSEKQEKELKDIYKNLITSLK